MTVQDSPTDLHAFTEAWQEWHSRQEARLADPHGFLAITGLHWLSEEPQRFPDAPGAWRTGADGVTVVLGEGEELVLADTTVRGEHHFGVLPERSSVNAVWGDAVIEVAKRGGHDIIRPRHPDTPLRAAFTGTPAYAPHPRWTVTGRYEAFDHAADSLLVLFTDATSGVTTYAANRALALDPPAEDGTVTLDFNRATNLPCAYTDLATCPLPPAENRLPLAIDAGEKIPYERGGS
ncbi:DUF1684 domain-containing protein [Streptomyces sp. NPDC048512]|uniref:DUF1684 domain-containing protein n=1 Tax=Streptomyces sp. NPDC048512 TaxID=3365563 RepID=UPI00372178D3